MGGPGAVAGGRNTVPRMRRCIIRARFSFVRIDPGTMDKLSISLISTMILFTTAMYPQQEGQLDPTFGVNGVAVLEVDTLMMSMADVHVDGDDRILTTGRVFTPDGWDVYVMRRMPDGTPDATFGDMGFVRLDLGSYWDIGTAIVIQPDGRVLVAAEASQNGLGSTVFVVRYQQDGSLDDTFGEGGIAAASPAALGHPYDVAVTGDGAVVVVGTSAYYDEVAVYRFTASGVPDTMFQTNGVLIEQMFPGTNVVQRVHLQPDGKMLLYAVYGSGGIYQIAVARLMADGARDTVFGINGVVRPSLGPGDHFPAAIGQQANGAIVVAWTWTAVPDRMMRFLRLGPDGTLDTGFGANGITTVSTSFRPDKVNDLVIQPDDAILFGGGTDLVDVDAVLVGRLTPDGQLDATFGTGGVVHTALPEAPSAAALRIGLQADGRLIAGLSGGGTPILLRYLAGPFVAVNEVAAPTEVVTASPNPASSEVVVRFDLRAAAAVAMDVLDPTGKVVAGGVQQRPFTVGTHRVQLYLGHLASGPYWVRLTVDGRHRMVRVIKE